MEVPDVIGDINGQQIRFTNDSGSEINVMPFCTYSKEGLHIDKKIEVE